ncbi:hypothetical protein HDR66_03665 [bacterium]|nr:hypothetical protein [bacterium]
MNARKLKVIAYIMRKYLQGYKLLKNAPGTPWTSVKMLLTYSYMDSDTLDINDVYEMVSADFSDFQEKEIQELLFCTKYAFFDEGNRELTYRKELRYYRMGDTPFVRANKDAAPLDVLRQRNLNHVNRPVARLKEDRIIFGYLFMPLAIDTVEYDKTFGEYVEEHYDKQKRKADIARLRYQQGLLQTLRHNLSR